MGTVKVVEINQKECLNCHVCISVCPVPYCLSDDKTVQINHDLCIGCGRCYKACPHNAISIVDDFNNFIESINNAKKVILIISPAYLMNFKNNSKNFIGWLRKNFILEGVFDESFGAEIYALLLNDYLKKTKKSPIITNQCPSIVEYIKIYKPFLTSYLAPFHSPTMITAKFIRKILNYNGVIAYLGPCLSKKREFSEQLNDNIIQLNITLENMIKHINQNNINIDNFPEGEFDFIPSEKAKFFIKAGGINNILNNKTYKMLNLEGINLYKKYFYELIDNIDNNINHNIKILDILNCEAGCHQGPGIINPIDRYEESAYIEKIEKDAIEEFNEEFKNQKIYEKVLTENKDLNFDRKYSFVSHDIIFTLNDDALKNIYSDLNKNEKKDFLNCKSCGYNNCREFATSCFFKVNNSSNCRVYNENKLNREVHDTSLSLEELSFKIKNLYSTSTNITQNLLNTKNLFDSLKIVIDNILNFNFTLNENTEKFKPIITAISEVSEQINLLSFNASIEASRTGETGKGFTVVAGEIRSLADKTKNEIDKINPILEIILNSSSGIINVSSTIDNKNSEILLNLNQLSNLLDNISNNINILYNSLK